ncbi:MAG: hypothetical protein V1918_10070 [Planctomycetota bacterium]
MRPVCFCVFLVALVLPAQAGETPSADRGIVCQLALFRDAAKSFRRAAEIEADEYADEDLPEPSKTGDPANAPVKITTKGIQQFFEDKAFFLKGRLTRITPLKDDLCEYTIVYQTSQTYGDEGGRYFPTEEITIQCETAPVPSLAVGDGVAIAGFIYRFSMSAGMGYESLDRLKAPIPGLKKQLAAAEQAMQVRMATAKQKAAPSKGMDFNGLEKLQAATADIAQARNQVAQIKNLLRQLTPPGGENDTAGWLRMRRQNIPWFSIQIETDSDKEVSLSRY